MNITKTGNSQAAPLLLIGLAYVTCFGSYVFVNVPFWDDWVLVQYGVDGLWELFKQVGRREQYFMTAPFVAIGHPMSWAIASFLSWGSVPFLAFFLLQSIGWSRSNALWAALFTAVSPLNQARFALAMTPYAISASLFVLGVYFASLSVRHTSLYSRVFSALLLLLSFSTNSFLTLSWLAPMVVFLTYRHTQPNRSMRDGFWFTLRRFELLILPVAYWISKAVFQPVYGLYANYNKFQMNVFEGLARSVFQLPAQIPDPWTFFPTLDHVIESAAVALVFLALAATVVFATKLSVATERGSGRANWLWVAGMALAAVSALFPYIMVGIQPAFHGLWETRHQTTLALVAGTFGFVFLRAALPSRAVPVISTVVVVVSVAFGVSASRQLLADVYESNAIIHSPTVAAIPEGTLVGVFEDDRPYRMFKRHFQFYDLSSMLNAHSPRKALAAMSNYEAVDPSTGTYFQPGSPEFPKAVNDVCASTVNLPQYGFGDVVSNGLFAEVTFRPKSPPPTLFQGLGYALGFLFSYEETVAHAVANLDVLVQTRAEPGIKCGDTPPVS